MNCEFMRSLSMYVPFDTKKKKKRKVIISRNYYNFIKINVM